MLQSLVAFLLVVVCAAYAAWTLLPAAGRRRIARALLKLALPGPLARFFGRHAASTSGTGCGNCDRNPASPPRADRPPAQGAPLVFHRRRKR